jgi:molybdenum cofactor guanylyltransferase
VVPRAPARESITGVILAGGLGTRMGGADKGLVVLDGIALIEHVLARLRPQVGEIIISANRNLDRYRTLGHRVVQDDAARFGAFSGPLVGMLAGLRHTCMPWVVFVPCDAPALSADLVAMLASATGGVHPALASCGGRRQPVFCLLPAALEPRLTAALSNGERRPDEFLRTVGAIEVAFDDAHAFSNINAMEPDRQGSHD